MTRKRPGHGHGLSAAAENLPVRIARMMLPATYRVRNSRARFRSEHVWTARAMTLFFFYGLVPGYRKIRYLSDGCSLGGLRRPRVTNLCTLVEVDGACRLLWLSIEMRSHAIGSCPWPKSYGKKTWHPFLTWCKIRPRGWKQCQLYVDNALCPTAVICPSLGMTGQLARPIMAENLEGVYAAKPRFGLVFPCCFSTLSSALL